MLGGILRFAVRFWMRPSLTFVTAVKRGGLSWFWMDLCSIAMPWIPAGIDTFWGAEARMSRRPRLSGTKTHDPLPGILHMVVIAPWMDLEGWSAGIKNTNNGPNAREVQDYLNTISTGKFGICENSAHKILKSVVSIVVTVSATVYHRIFKTTMEGSHYLISIVTYIRFAYTSIILSGC